MWMLGIDPSVRFCGISLMWAEPESPYSTVRIVDWKVSEALGVAKIEPPDVIEKARTDFTIGREMWQREVGTRQDPAVAIEWVFGRWLTTPSINHIGYVYCMYYLFTFWSKGRCVTCYPSQHLWALERNTGIQVMTDNHSPGVRIDRKSNKQKTKMIVNQLFEENPGIEYPIKEKWGLLRKNKDRYEAVSDSVSVGLYGLNNFEQLLKRKPRAKRYKKKWPSRKKKKKVTDEVL